jgi:hypothetical protein
MSRFIALGLAALLPLACTSGDKPPTPYNFTVTSAGGGVELRWDCDAWEGVAPARFLLEKSEGGNYNFYDYAWAAGNNRFLRDDAVSPNEWYYYRVSGWWEEPEGELGPASYEVGVKVE